MARFTPSARQLAYIRRYAGKFTDSKMAAALGLKRHQVAHIRASRGIVGMPGGGICGFWTPERMAVLYQAYIIEGRPAKVVAKMIGDTTDEKVRKRAAEARRYHGDKWARDPAFQNANLRGSPVGRRATPKPHVPKTRFMVGSDAELVADFLARQPVTVCETGYAAGLTAWERAIHAAPPPGSSLRERHARGLRKLAERAA